MAVYNYKAIESSSNDAKEGTIQAPSIDVAISTLQNRGFVISSIHPEKEKLKNLTAGMPFFNRVKTRDLVILSQQMATLFESRVSALQVFKLLGSESDNPLLSKALVQIGDDIQGGSTISKALGQHPNIFSSFYVNMVKAGEESGKLDKVFRYMADYLDRTYGVISKTRNALIYPAFVITVFIAVMALMFTVIIPKITGILEGFGSSLPIYTKIIIWISDFFVSFWPIMLIIIIGGGITLWNYVRTPDGRMVFSRVRLSIPYVGTLYRKLYLSRIADNMETLLISGITMLRALEITADIIDDAVYKSILVQAYEEVKGGSTLSKSLSNYHEIPQIMVQMIKAGEETGRLGNILKTIGHFYTREVDNAVDTLVGMIEPIMIVVLAGGVAILLAGVLLPIYNLASAI